jgi:hypothetical protein
MVDAQLTVVVKGHHRGKRKSTEQHAQLLAQAQVGI